MRRTTLSSFFLCALTLAACGPGQVDLTVEVDLLDPETGQTALRTLGDLPVQLVPFDRDALFAELAAGVGTPEPELPESLRIARDSIADATEVWRQRELEWLPLQNEVESLNRELAEYEPAAPMYQVIFRERTAAERIADEAEARKNEAFALVDRLATESNPEMERFRAELTAWEDQAFANYDAALVEAIEDSGHEIMTDTTDADGFVQFIPATDEWWVYARYPFTLQEELYWNVPIEVRRNAPVVLTLSRDNAEVREIF